MQSIVFGIEHQKKHAVRKHVATTAMLLILAARTAAFSVVKPPSHSISSRQGRIRGVSVMGTTGLGRSSRSSSYRKGEGCSMSMGNQHQSRRKQQQRGWVGLGMSFEGGDFPSDVGDAVPAVLADDNPELRETMKREILSIAATSNRGQVATQEEKDAATDLIYQLEALNPTPDATNVNTIGGAWELVYTDTQPFRCSPFFMALGELFGEEKGQAENLFALHRAATSNGEIGRVRQTISEATLVSEIDLKVGILPGLPMALKGTVVTKARLNPVSSDSFSVAVESTSVTNNNILSFLDDAVKVPVEQVYSTLRGGVPESKLSTFYLDENMRISRMSDDHVFVFVRAP